jgi:hypothetical protein
MTILEIIAAIPPVDVLLALQQSVQQAAAAAVETVRVEVSTPTPPDVSGWHKARDVADVIVKLGAAGALISGDLLVSRSATASADDASGSAHDL